MSKSGNTVYVNVYTNVQCTHCMYTGVEKRVQDLAREDNKNAREDFRLVGCCVWTYVYTRSFDTTDIAI